ncbi:hypothetical protein F5878DRAFT_668351, partial [Lentinula raphanica]
MSSTNGLRRYPTVVHPTTQSTLNYSMAWWRGHDKRRARAHIHCRLSMNLNVLGMDGAQDLLWNASKNTDDNTDDPFDPMNFDYSTLNNFDDLDFGSISFDTSNSLDNMFAGLDDTPASPLFLPSPPSLDLDQSFNNDDSNDDSNDFTKPSSTTLKNANGLPADTPTDTLSDGFLSFASTAQIHRNPLLPTQAVRQHAPKRTLNAAQIQTMNAAKAAKRLVFKPGRVRDSENAPIPNPASDPHPIAW